MKILSHHVKHILVFLGVTAFSVSSHAFSGSPFGLDSVISCNPLVHVSVDNNCEAPVTPDMILEGVNSGFNEYSVSIETHEGDPVPNPVPKAYLGETLTVNVTHDPSGNNCWGDILLEDKSVPEVFCFDVDIQCFQDPNSVPAPPASDNCDSNPSVNLVEEIIDATDPCTGVTITRVYTAIDDSGNESLPCNQTITTILPSLPDFPEDALWECSDYLNHNNVINPSPLTNNLNTTGSGVPDVAVGNYCPYNVGHSDATLPACGESFKIVRTWTILNWCTGEIITQDINGDDNVQLIDVLDTLPPMVEIAPFTVSANISGVHPEPCKSQDFLNAPTLSDECGTWTVQIFTPIGEAIYVNGTGAMGGYIPSPGLPQGFHDIFYEVRDECGNITTDTVEIEVIDDIAPIAICDELSEVALSSDGLAEIEAIVFDDGSHDNCCIDRFEVAPMTDNCENGTDFNSTLILCCEDVSQSPVQATVRVFDCDGNYNDCMVDIEVTDKINPELIYCPPHQTIDCDFYKDEICPALDVNDFSVLGQFGNPEFEDNCQLVFVEFNVTENIDPCGEGHLIRKWVVTDPGFNPFVECTQFIYVEHVSDWVVQFPDDILLSCGDTLPDSGEPETTFETCELIAVSYVDQQFNVVADACWKVKRTWTVINWCTVGTTVMDEVVESSEIELLRDLNGNGILEERVYQDGLNTQNYDPNAFLKGAQPDGYITYEQIIKVNDNVAPVIVCPENYEVCITENDCLTTIDLPLPELTDCSEQLTLTANGDLGFGLGPFDNVTLGTYSMTYSVSDNCGNSSSCQFELTTVDCKNPTPYCLNGLIVELQQNAMLDIWATDFDAGSFDNCSDSLKFSFTSDTNDIVTTVDCFNIGENIITIWVTDEAGNQALCETFVFVQDNMGACMGPPLIAGTIETEAGQGIKDVEVKLSGDTAATYTTIPDGFYEFAELTPGYDYTVTPEKDINYLNGVTTFDLVLISKHILGTIQLDSPFKILAADVNQSGSVSTTDLVLIRRLILNIDDSFADSPSWRFMDKDFDFPNPLNPFLSPIPEVIDFNNLDDEITDADFIGWKVGDVNCSANPDNLTGSDDRNGLGIFEIKTQERQFIENESVNVDFYADDLIAGFQYTLEFDNEKLTFENFEAGILSNQNVNLTRVSEGLIMMSWNGEFSDLNKKLFSLKFISNSVDRLSNVLKLTPQIIQKEAYTPNLEIKDIELIFEKSTIVLYQNTPNPFINSTNISFNLSTSTFAELNIYDTSGKKIQSVSGDFEKGLNEISFDLEEVSSGVYYYQLTTETGSLIKKMVK